MSPNKDHQKICFKVYGLITCQEFQLVKTYLERLSSRIPHEYYKPSIVPMLDVDWNLFLTKIRREIGGEKLWTLQKKVVIFKNGELFGDDHDLLDFVGSKYNFSISEDFDVMGAQHFIRYVQQQQEFGNIFVYFTIAIDKKIIGTMLFELYAVAVPNTARMFVKRCKKKIRGYSGTCIQRIVWPSWIQCGGWYMNNYNVSCENYCIPHNKRGVLSMCNNGKHCGNYTQFNISLEPTPWMNTKYVAFGQLVYGDHILHMIQGIPTKYEEPLKEIDIVSSGTLDLFATFDTKYLAMLKKFISTKDSTTGLHLDVRDNRDRSSDLNCKCNQDEPYSLGSSKLSRQSLVEVSKEYTSNLLSTNLVDYVLEMHRRDEGEEDVTA